MSGSLTIKQQIESTAAALLEPYLDRLRRSASIPEARVINDPIWGSVRLEPWEVAIIDSPLMQRLRGIRQLGVVHWVYPSAVHTRFEHSIGAMHCASEILTSLERNSGLAGMPIVGDETHKLVRVATLLHDSGHTVLSHVGERVAERLPGVEEYVGELFAELHSRKKPSVSEAIAVGFVRSPAFQALLAAPQAGADFVSDPKAACEQIARLILGAPAIPGRAFLSLVISGAFDADKLDYMVRDCSMAGVPCAVDVSRAIGKLHCIEVQPDEQVELLKKYREWAGVDPTKSVRVLALPRSATTVLNELAVTRTTLYEKIYFHPKVRVLEAVARHALQQLQVPDLSTWIRLADDVVLREAAFVRLRDRDLPKRAFQISRPIEADSDEETKADPAEGEDGATLTAGAAEAVPAKDEAGGDAVPATENEDDDLDEGTGWRRLTRAFDEGDFDETVRSATLAVCKLLGDPRDSVDLFADRPNVKKLKLDAYAFLGDSPLDLESVAAGPAGQRAEVGKFLSRERVYVFAPGDVLVAACLASRKIFGALGLDTSGHATIPLKIEPTELRRASQTLEAAGFFEGGPGALAAEIAARMPSRRQRHLEDFLRTATDRVQALATRIGQYQPADGRRVDAKSIAAFLRQFVTRERARTALRMLESIDFVDRSALSSALAETMNTVRADGPLLCVSPLGGLADSSSHLAYLMLDLPEDQRAEVLTLPEALARVRRGDAGRVLLWDDFCSKAGHARTVLAQWLDIKNENILDEHHVDPLETPELLRQLSGRIVLGFARARDEGLRNLGDVFREFKLEGMTTAPVPSARLIPDRSNLFETASTILPDAAAREDLRDFLMARSSEILSPKLQNSGWTEERLKERLLGYGGASLLVAFPYNVPTVTVTPIWAERTGVWRALLPRREKPARKRAG